MTNERPDTALFTIVMLLKYWGTLTPHLQFTPCKYLLTTEQPSCFVPNNTLRRPDWNINQWEAKLARSNAFTGARPSLSLRLGKEWAVQPKPY